MPTAILEGYAAPPRRRRRGNRGRGSEARRAAMRACAVNFKVTSSKFHACVRRKTGGKRRRS